MDNKTEYTISLKDLFSQGIHKADAATQSLEGHVFSLKGIVKELGSVLGISFAVFKGFEFIKSGVEKVEELHQAEAQVAAALLSTHEAAGLSKEALEANAIALAANSKFSRAGVTDMQSLLLTFTQVKKKIFEDAEPAIMDLATRMGGDLKGATIQVGKALNDPIQGLNALRRVGVSFTKDQRAVITKLAETGHMAEAQRLILKELNTEFAGSSAAAAAADPYFRFNKIMESLKLQVGAVAMSIGKALMPYLTKFLTLIKASITWLTEHKSLLKAIGIVLGLVAGYMLTMNAILKLQAWYTGLSTAAIVLNTFVTEGWRAAILAVNIAMEANPIGLIIVGLAALVLAIKAVIDHYELLDEVYNKAGTELKETAINNETRAVLDQAEAYKKLGYTKVESENMAIEAARKSNQVLIEKLTLQMQEAQLALAEKTNSLGGSFRNDEEMKNFLAAKEALKAAVGQRSVLGKDIFTKKDVLKGEDGAKGAAGIDTAKGPQHTVITINIDKLIEKFQITTQTMGESVGSIKEQVVKALIEAVNDSQIVAGI